MTQLRIEHDYGAPARKVWRICTDFAALAEVCEPFVTFGGLPSGRLQPDQTITVDVRIFGILPPQPYDMRLELFDDAKMHFFSNESGAGVKRWNHDLRVIPVGDHACRLVEVLDIDAGWMTPIYVAWARKLYRHRHKGRLRLLA